MKIMAVDLGLVRTGVAISDETGFLATPIGTVEEPDRDKLLQTITALAKKHGAGRIVVGLPKNMDGSKGESACAAEEFAKRLESAVEMPVVLWDERMTTMSAIGYLNETNVRGKKRKQVIDTVSAVIILQSYLDSPTGGTP